MRSLLVVLMFLLIPVLHACSMAPAFAGDSMEGPDIELVRGEVPGPIMPAIEADDRNTIDHGVWTSIGPVWMIVGMVFGNYETGERLLVVDGGLKKGFADEEAGKHNGKFLRTSQEAGYVYTLPGTTKGDQKR